MSNPLNQTVLPTFRRWVSNSPSFRIEWPTSPPWRFRPWWLIETTDALHRTLLGMLKTIIEERFDPAPMIEALANDHRGWYRRRLKRVAKRLRDGCSLIDALEQTVGALSPQQTLSLRIAFQNGTLIETLNSLLDDDDTTTQESRVLYGQANSYMIVMLVTIGIAAGFLNIFIAPKFASIAEQAEFGSQAIPAQPSIWFKYLPRILFAASALIILAAFIRRKMPWNPSRLLPLRRWTHKERHSEITDILARTLRSGRPLNGTISSLARYHDSPEIRQRLLLARNEIELGIPIWDSLSQVGIIPHNLATTLSATEGSAVQAWILARFSQVKKTSIQRQRRIMATFLQPLFVFICGLCVLWIAKTYFGFLIQIIMGVQP